MMTLKRPCCPLPVSWEMSEMKVEIHYNDRDDRWRVEHGDIEYGTWIEGEGYTLEAAAADFRRKVRANAREAENLRLRAAKG